MINRQIISTEKAPAAIGPYSQAVRVADTVYLSGQIPLDPQTMEIVEGGIQEQTKQVFRNLSAVADAAGASLNNAVKVNISLIDMGDFNEVNEVMTEVFKQPYPARACVQVAALPKGVAIEVEVILSL